MSQKIDDVLRVLDFVRKSFRPDQIGSLSRSRIDAIHSIAESRGVTYQTIGDAYLRRLAPDVEGTRAFDRFTEEWLTKKSDKLVRVLQKHALDDYDRARIDEFFK